jgi:hypothetical protein
VFVPFIRVDNENELIDPKFLLPCSPPAFSHGFEFDYNLSEIDEFKNGLTSRGKKEAY